MTASEKRIVFMKNIYNMYNIKYDKILCNKSKCKIQVQFKYSRDDTYIFSKQMFDFLQHMYLHSYYFKKNSSRLTGHKAFANGSHCSKFQSAK